MSVHVLTLSNMNISATSRQIPMKFSQKHHWGGGKAALDFAVFKFTDRAEQTVDLDFHFLPDAFE